MHPTVAFSPPLRICCLPYQCLDTSSQINHLHSSFYTQLYFQLYLNHFRQVPKWPSSSQPRVALQESTGSQTALTVQKVWPCAFRFGLMFESTLFPSLINLIHMACPGHRVLFMGSYSREHVTIFMKGTYPWHSKIYLTYTTHQTISHIPSRPDENPSRHST